MDWNVAVAELERALVSGVLTVEYEGRRVTYRSLAEVERALAMARARVAASGVGRATRTHVEYIRD